MGEDGEEGGEEVRRKGRTEKISELESVLRRGPGVHVDSELFARRHGVEVGEW